MIKQNIIKADAFQTPIAFYTVEDTGGNGGESTTTAFQTPIAFYTVEDIDNVQH